MTTDTNVLARWPFSSGMVLGLLPLPVHLLLPADLSQQLAALTLVVIAGVYVGYAFKDGRPRVIWIELVTALLFSAAAWLGLNGYPLAIVIALALHGIWDLLHYNLIETEIPHWYIPFCSIVDWVMATYLLVLWGLGPNLG